MAYYRLGDMALAKQWLTRGIRGRRDYGGLSLNETELELLCKEAEEADREGPLDIQLAHYPAGRVSLHSFLVSTCNERPRQTSRQTEQNTI